MKKGFQLLLFVLFSHLMFAGGDEIDYNLITISPNPFVDSIQIKNLPQGNKMILVENEYGQIVQAYYIKETTYTIAEEDLMPGIYFLKIELNGEMKTFRILKRKA